MDEKRKSLNYDLDNYEHMYSKFLISYHIYLKCRSAAFSHTWFSCHNLFRGGGYINFDAGSIAGWSSNYSKHIQCYIQRKNVIFKKIHDSAHIIFISPNAYIYSVLFLQRTFLFSMENVVSSANLIFHS